MSTTARMRRFLLSLLTAGALASGLLATSATGAFADYGNGAQYQIEISDNCNGLQSCLVAQGDGIWLWIELTPSSPGATSGTGDYEGSDCVHLLPTPAGLFSGAGSDSGNVTWSSDGTTITITGAKLLGGTVPVTITVPAAYGHYQEPTAEIFPSFPIPGMAQLQVAR